MQKRPIALAAIALLITGGMTAAQQSTNPPMPQQQYDKSGVPTEPQKTPRLDSEGYNMDAPAPPETTGKAQPRNSPDPNPLPGEQPRPIPR